MIDQSPASDAVARYGPAALLLLTGALYLSTVGAGFVWDDRLLVETNDDLASLANIPAFFRYDLWHGLLEQGSGYYRPLFQVWLTLIHVCFGPSPALYHLGGLGWHLLAVAAVLRLTTAATGPRAGLAGAALFALHPIQSEAVVWISAHNDPMAAALGLWGLCLLLPERPGSWRIAGAGALTLGAVLTKESAVVLPLFLLCYDLWRGRGWRVGPLLALGVGVALALGLRANAELGGAPIALADHLGFVAERLHVVLGTLGALMLVPWPLSVARSVRWLEIDGFHLALGALFWVGLALAIVAPRPGRRAVRLGALWFAVAIVPPTLGILAFGLLSERYVYLPMVGLAVTLAGLVGERGARWVAAPGLVWVALVSLRLPDWATHYAILEAAARDTPNPYVDHLYARALLEHGDRGLALAYFQKVLMAPVPEEQACQPGLALAIEGGRLDLAREMGAANIDRRCGEIPAFVGLYARTLALSGDWEGARTVVARLGVEDPSGNAALVRGALALRDGDAETYARLAAAWDGALPFEGGVRQLVESAADPPR